MDSLLREAADRHRIPGIAAAVMRRGELLYSGTFGFANLEHRVPVSDATVFQIASLSKQFLAALILLMQRDGLMLLDHAVRAIMPELPREWEAMTIRHLLSHTAGISDAAYEELNLRLDYTDDALVAAITASPPEAPPGERFQYANSGYVLLGLAVKRLTGRFYGDLLRERIFMPLSMETAHVTEESEIVPNRASGYELDENGRWSNQEYVSSSLNQLADGGVSLALRDLIAWERALTTGQLLEASEAALLWSPAVLNDGAVTAYGLGWGVHDTPRGKMVEHSGGWQGFSCHMVRILESGVSAIVLCNVDEAPAAGIARDLLGAV